MDVTTAFQQKLAAIACHRSQVAETAYLTEDVRRCNVNYGRQGGTMYAEAFNVLHPFCEA